MKKLNLLALAALLAASVSAAACTKNVKGDSDSDSKTGIAASSADKDSDIEVSDENIPDSQETDIRDINSFVSEKALRPVPFNYDKYDLSDEAREIIKENAAIINANKQWKLVVEGYCDNRGTTEYNLSLGQKRANSVRDYYVRLGVKSSNIGTISYGIENPLCYENTEECWEMNRRAETKVK